jgi:hypothetical protein
MFGESLRVWLRQGNMAIFARILVLGILVFLLFYYNVWDHVVGAFHDGLTALWRRVAW